MHHMYREIRETPEALLKVKRKMEEIREIAENLVEKGIKRIFAVGCGTSYYIAVGGLYPLIKYSNIDVYPLPSSEFFLNYLNKVDSKAAVVGISRSGSTAETLEALKRANRRGGLTIAISCNEEAEMLEIVDKSFAVKVEEKSIIMTKSFSTMSYALSCLSAHYLKEIGIEEGKILVGELEKIPDVSKITLEKGEVAREFAKKFVEEGIRGFIYLGSGPAYALALEGSLKIKETSYSMSEAMPTLEFRHGPMALLGEKIKLVIIALEGDTLEVTLRLIQEVKEKGHAPFVLTNSDKAAEVEGIYIPVGLNETLTVPVMITPLQLLAYYYCVSKGLNPDKPRHLVKYVGRF